MMMLKTWMIIEKEWYGKCIFEYYATFLSLFLDKKHPSRTAVEVNDVSFYNFFVKIQNIFLVICNS